MKHELYLFPGEVNHDQVVGEPTEENLVSLAQAHLAQIGELCAKDSFVPPVLLASLTDPDYCWVIEMRLNKLALRRPNIDQ